MGRVHPEKGVHLLVRAFRRVAESAPKARLRIIGPAEERQGGGGDSYLRMLKADIAMDPVEGTSYLVRGQTNALSFTAG